MHKPTKIAGLKQAFLKELGLRLADDKFAAKTSEQSFVRSFEIGRSVLHVSFIPHKEDVDLTIDMAVRIGEIEDIVNRFDSKRTGREKMHSMTIGAELGNISTGRQMRWTLEEIENVSPVVDSVAISINDVALPLFEEFRSSRSVNEALSNEQRARLFSPFVGPRFMRMAAASWVVNKSLREEAFRAQIGFLDSTNDLYAEDFRNMIKTLSTRNTEN